MLNLMTKLKFGDQRLVKPAGGHKKSEGLKAKSPIIIDMINSIFLNLPVQNLKRSVDFFTELGFTFNPQFTGDDSTCMIVTPTIYVMLSENAKFKSFIDKPIAERASSEVIISLSCESKDEVNKLAATAHNAGARKLNEPEDHGFMYSWGFEDLDGHLWDLFWMNPEHVE